MIAADEGALSCDFMEAYHIMDWRALPARQAALFAYGLREDSRIRRKLSGSPVGLDTVLLAMAVDALNVLVWQNTADGHEGRNQPKPVLSLLRGDAPESSGLGFDSAEDFDSWRKSMIGGDSSA